MYVEDNTTPTLLDVYNGDVTIEEFVAKTKKKNGNIKLWFWLGCKLMKMFGSSGSRNSDIVQELDGVEVLKMLSILNTIYRSCKRTCSSVKQEYEDIMKQEKIIKYSFSRWTAIRQTWNKELLEEDGTTY